MIKITAKKLIKAFIPYGFIVLYRYFIKKRRMKLNGFDWAMTVKEQELFKEYIRNANVYLEFGSGGSTIAALLNNGGKVYSVESSKDWIEHLRQKNEIIEKAESSGRLNLIYADIGKTSTWGHPIVSDNENDTDRFLSYYQRIFGEYSETKLADVVLIDGRFRVACCLSVLLETKENTIIIFHDYWDRPKYHIVRKFVVYIDGVDRLMICKKNPEASINEIRDEYEKNKYNCE